MKTNEQTNRNRIINKEKKLVIARGEITERISKISEVDEEV